MSLLNDALKRAKEAQRPDTRSSVSSLRSIETRSKERPFAGRLLVVVIFLLLVAAFGFIGLAMTGRLAKKNIVAPQMAPAPPVQVAAAAPPVVVTAPVAPVQPTPPPAVVAPVAKAVPVQPAPAPAPVVAPPPTPLVLPSTLHVQGVAYDPVRPWAIVSGRTVYVGDIVRGVRVMEITRDSVTFGKNGQSNLLFVGQ